MTSREDMEAVIEAILFVAHDPVSRARLVEVFGKRQREESKEAVEAVVERYRERDGRGFMIDEAAGGLRFVTRPDLHSYLKRFFEVSSRNKLSMPALETLAIIAYRQPITAPEVAELRNKGGTGTIKKLLERRLIRIAGRKEVVGKPFLYATTREFLMHFGLRSLKELPPLEQFEELFGDEIEAASDGMEPDAEEIADREAAALAEAEDDDADRQETEAIEEERAAAEEAQEAQEVQALQEEAPREKASLEKAPQEEASQEGEAPEEELARKQAPEDRSDGLGGSDRSDEEAPEDDVPPVDDATEPLSETEALEEAKA